MRKGDRRRAVAAPVRYSRRGLQGAARYRNASTGTPRALCAEAEKAQAVVAFLRARSAESWAMPAHHPPANNYPRGNARIRRAMSWSIARIIAAATRSQSAPINGRMTFGFPTSSRGSSARPAVRGVLTSAPIRLRPKLMHENRRPVVASCDLLCPRLLPCDPYHSHGRCCG